MAACVQAVLALTRLAAPQVLIKLRLKGFALQQHPDASQVGVSHWIAFSHFKQVQTHPHCAGDAGI